MPVLRSARRPAAVLVRGGVRVPVLPLDVPSGRAGDGGRTATADRGRTGIGGGGVTYDEAMSLIRGNSTREVARVGAGFGVAWRFGRPVLLGAGRQFIDYTPTRED